MLLGNFKLKQWWNTTAHLLEWSDPKTLTPPNVDEDVEQQKLIRWVSPTHSLSFPKTLTPPNVDEDVEQQKLIHCVSPTHALSFPKTLTPPNVDEDVEQQKLIHCWWECKVVQMCWKTLQKFPFFFLSFLLRYNWQAALYKFKGTA